MREVFEEHDVKVAQTINFICRDGCHLKTAEMVMLSVNAVGITVVCDIITAVIRF